MMESNGRTPQSNEKKPSENSAPPCEQEMPSENTASSSVFVNHAEIAWNESRRKWIGNAPHRSERTMRDPIISWSTTYEELLLTHDPFPQRIPLSVRHRFLINMLENQLSDLQSTNTGVHTNACGVFMDFLQEMVDFLVDIWQDEGLFD